MSPTFRQSYRKLSVVAAALTLAAAGAGCGTGPEAPSAAQPKKAPKLPSKPVSLTVLDVGGVLSFMKPQIEAYRKAHPDLVKEIKYDEAPSTEIVSKVKAQQNAGRVSISLVLGGSDAIGAGIQQNLWYHLLPEFKSALGNTANYTQAATNLREIGQGQAIPVATELTGPLLEYDPKHVQDPPSTPQELLQWAKAHPKKFGYAQPASSGPGRQFLMSLPYLLGDQDPRNPVQGWSKTWSYLQQLDKFVGPYPTATDQLMSSLAHGSVWMIATAAGWDLATRTEGTLPERDRIQTFDGFKWIAAGHFMAVPKGLDDDQLAVTLNLMNSLLTPQAQEQIYTTQKKVQPQPAIKGVSVDQLPADVKAAIQRTTRPEYAHLFSDVGTEPELPAAALGQATDRWDREIGG